jgi:hypothetical protein
MDVPVTRPVLLAASLLSATGAGATKHQKDGSPEDEFGLTPTQAVEVCSPDGEREYLSRLRCPDGRAPRHTRNRSEFRNIPDTPDAERVAQGQVIERKSLRKGDRDYHMVDAYQLTCGHVVLEVFLDMYHCGAAKPSRAPVPLSLKKAKR